MSRSLSNAIKLTAEAARERGKPTDIRYGTVVSTSPLKVKISAELTLPSSVLVVPQHLTNYSVNVTVDWNTDSKSGGAGESSFSSHNHGISGTKKLTIRNALAVGDKVALLQQAGGQSFYILDRI